MGCLSRWQFPDVALFEYVDLYLIESFDTSTYIHQEKHLHFQRFMFGLAKRLGCLPQARGSVYAGHSCAVPGVRENESGIAPSQIALSNRACISGQGLP